MSSAPTIAAVVLNYNYAKYVADAIDGVLAQDRPFDQVVVVNDGSTDESMSIISAYEPRVEVLDIANGGQLNGAFTAVERLHTDYVYFLDADDVAEPDLVEALSSAMANHPAKIQFQLTGMDQDNQPLDSVFPTYPPGYDADQMRDDNQSLGFYLCPPTSANVFSVEALRRIDREALRPRDFIDGTPALVMPYLGEVVTLDRPLARYRVHGSSDSQHSRPTPEVMVRDRERFKQRWAEAEKVVPGLSRPAPGTTLFEAELALNHAALGPRRPAAGVVWRYVHNVSRSRFELRRKVMLSAWAAGLAVAGAQSRRQLIYARRSPVNRSGGLQAVVTAVLHPSRLRRSRDGGRKGVPSSR